MYKYIGGPLGPVLSKTDYDTQKICDFNWRMLPAEHGLKSMRKSGGRLNIKTVLSTYGDFHVKDKTAVRESPYLERPSFLLRRPPEGLCYICD